MKWAKLMHYPWYRSATAWFQTPSVSFSTAVSPPRLSRHHHGSAMTSGALGRVVFMLFKPGLVIEFSHSYRHMNDTIAMVPEYGLRNRIPASKRMKVRSLQAPITCSCSDTWTETSSGPLRRRMKEAIVSAPSGEDPDLAHLRLCIQDESRFT